MSLNYHQPVMLAESMEALAIQPEGLYVDATYGGGGHSAEILYRLGPDGKLIAFDQDTDASQELIDDRRFTFIQANFRHLKSNLRLHNIKVIDGLLADLGISSHQIDTAERGFSFQTNAPLDLRMNQHAELSARDIVNTYSEESLRSLFALYGELPNAGALAKEVCRQRADKPIDTTFDLKNSLCRFAPRGRENKFYAMVFQALRIEVNGELDALRQLLQQATAMLSTGGRLAIISYHSLEDRIVKNWMKSGNFEGIIEKDFFGNPLTPLKVVGKMQTPSEAELASNNRSRSAKLRVAEKLADNRITDPKQ